MIYVTIASRILYFSDCPLPFSFHKTADNQKIIYMRGTIRVYLLFFSITSRSRLLPLRSHCFVNLSITAMARTGTRASTATTMNTRKAGAAASVKSVEQSSDFVVAKQEEVSKAKPGRATRKRAASTAETSPVKKIKTDKAAVTAPPPSQNPSLSQSPPPAPATKTSPAKKKSDLQAKKLKSHTLYANTSPFPTFPHPTTTEAQLAHSILTRLHGPRTRPKEVIASKTTAGCGDSPSVLDALVRTILSQNTSDANSTRAKLSMDRIYGGSDNWARIVDGGQAKLQEAIKCGGLSVVKSRVIISILRQVHGKYGKYSLDHLHNAETDEAYKEMLAFQGVGPKTASCVLLFCLRRESFAVDTHVWRIAGLLGWRPKEAGREATQAHLEVMIPAQDKYGLHVLMVTHGKRCEECKAGGKSVGKCELRKAFQREKGEKEEEIKMEEQAWKTELEK